MRTKVILLGAIASLFISVSAQAADAGAEQAFKRGVEYYREADYRSSLAEFRKAYQASNRDYRVLYNVAQCEYQLTNYVGAMEAFEGFLADGGTGIGADRRAEVTQELAKVRARVAQVELKSSLEVEVSIDGESFVKLTDKPIRMNPGRHRVETRLAGYETRTETLDVVGGDTKSLDVTPTKKLAVASAPTPVQSGEPSEKPSWIVPGVLWGVTGALGATAGVLGVVALGKSNSLATERTVLNADASALEDRSSSTKTMALVSDIFLGATAVAGIAAIYMTVKTAGQGSSSPDPKAAAWLSVGPGNVSLRGTFQ